MPIMYKTSVSAVLAAGVLLAGAAAADPAPKAELGAWGVDLSAMDRSVSPGDDFFRHVNGQWLKTFEIPADFSNYGAFTVLFERSEERVRTIIEDARRRRGRAGADMQRIGDFYAAWLDTDRINSLGLKPAEADLKRIAELQTHDGVARLMAEPEPGVTPLITPYIYVDAKKTDRYLVHFTQAGLGMPDRDYYLEDRFEKARVAYKVFVTRMLDLAGFNNAADRADAVLALETRIAEAHWPIVKQRDPNLTYNFMTGAQLTGNAPEFPWAVFLQTAGIADQKAFIVNEPDAVQKLAKIFRETPVRTWKDWMALRYLSANAAVLPVDFDAAHFAFYGTALSGQPEQRARWKRGVAAVNSALGEAVGREYVARHFPPESRKMMTDMIGHLRAALAERIKGNAWMSAGTKREALAKLAKFRAYIGYPDEWRDYGDLKVDRRDALGNLRRARASGYRFQRARLDGPVDPGREWSMTPQTVNAYYSPPRNAIYFPAGILQAPFFDPHADAAVNFGGIGTVIGHEIGHGFDDQGRKQDGDGLLRDWWSRESAARFETLAGRLGDQYAKYSPIEGHFINPDLTMGENVGDLGGIAMALHAYRLSLKGKSAPVLDGYAGEQRFFLAYGQIWRRKYREAELLNRLTTDPHSPSEFRTNGIVRNVDAWYEAFGVKPNNRLYLKPKDRVSIW